MPGAEEAVDTVSLTREFKMPLYPARRLIFKYGTRARDILKMIKADPYLGSVICNCEAITEAELRYCIRNEWAYTVDDLRRRARLGMGPCQGMRCTYKAAAILGDELGWDSVKTKEETVNFLQERWKERGRCLTAIRSRKRNLIRRCIIDTPHPNPLPQGERGVFLQQGVAIPCYFPPLMGGD